MSRVSAARVSASGVFLKRKSSDLDSTSSTMVDDSSFNNNRKKLKMVVVQQAGQSLKLRFSRGHYPITNTSSPHPTVEKDDRHDYKYATTLKIAPQETRYQMKSDEIVDSKSAPDHTKDLRVEKLKIRFAVTIDKARKELNLPPLKLEAQDTCARPVCNPRTRRETIERGRQRERTTQNFVSQETGTRKISTTLKIAPQEAREMKSDEIIDSKSAADSKDLRVEKLKTRFAVTIDKARKELNLLPLKLETQETESRTRPICNQRRETIQRESQRGRRPTLNVVPQETGTRKSSGDRKAADTNTPVILGKQEIITQQKIKSVSESAATDYASVRKEVNIEKERQAAREKLENMKRVDFPDNLGAMYDMDRMLGRGWRQFQYQGAFQYITTPAY